MTMPAENVNVVEAAALKADAETKAAVVVELDLPRDLPASLLLNYPEFPDSCRLMA